MFAPIMATSGMPSPSKSPMTMFAAEVLLVNTLGEAIEGGLDAKSDWETRAVTQSVVVALNLQDKGILMTRIYRRIGPGRQILSEIEIAQAMGGMGATLPLAEFFQME